METAIQPSEEQITTYLRDNPQFFERRPDLLAMMHLPSLHGSGTVSLAERQQGAQRDKIRVLETKLSEFLQYGQETTPSATRCTASAWAFWRPSNSTYCCPSSPKRYAKILQCHMLHCVYGPAPKLAAMAAMPFSMMWILT